MLVNLILSQTLNPLTVVASGEINSSVSYTTERFYPQQILSATKNSFPLKWTNQEGALVSELDDVSTLEKFSTTNSATLIYTNTAETTTGTETNLPQAKILDPITSDIKPASTTPDIPINFIPETSPTSTASTTETQIKTFAEEEILATLPETGSSTEPTNIILPTPEETQKVTEPEIKVEAPDPISAPDEIATSEPKEILPGPEKQLTSPTLEYSNFIGNEKSSEASNLKIPGLAKIKLSFASLPISSGQLLIEYSVASSSWQTLTSIFLDTENSNADRGGYFSVDLPQSAMNNLPELNIRLKILAPESAWTNISASELFFLDAIWLEAGYKTISPEEEEDLLAAQQLGSLTPEEFAHLEFFSPLMDLFMPADLSNNPITLGSNKSGFNSLPLQMLPVNVSTATPPTRLGQKVVYTDAYKSTDLEYIMSDSGLKENIILKDKNHPSRFRYLTNLDKYDSVQTSPSTIVLYVKGHKGQALYKRYTMSAPIMTDSNGSESSQLTFKINKNLITLIPDTSWLKNASYPVVVDPNVDLSILNVSSFPVAGEFWTIGFTTVGQDNLTITPGDQATIDDMEFSSLTCNGNNMTPSVSVEGQVSVSNWSCDGIGEIKFLDKKTGHHHMAFAFGSASQDAYNGANTWNGLAGDSNWSTGGNWSLGTPPALADDVVISTVATININSSASINSLVVGNSGGGVASVLNFNYDAIGGSPLAITGNMTVYSGASITHSVSSAGAIVGSANINVAGNSTIVGNISLNSKGYTGGYGTGKGTDNNQAGGGGYGGNGSAGISGTVGGLGYGSTTLPTNLGSGGGNSGCGSIGGSGGGALKLNVTGTTTISGTISANGGNGASSPCWNAGGGSGGSIFISTNILTGAGTISAIGGNGVSGSSGSGDGGGGRISINYTTDNSTITYSVYGGSNSLYGGSGTIYKKNSAQSYGDLTIDNNNIGGSTETIFGKTLLTSATYNTLLIKNSASLYLTSSSATTTTLTISNNGHYNAQTSTTLNYSSLNWGGIITDSGGTLAVLNQNQDLTIPTSSKLTFNVLNGTRTYNNISINGTLTSSSNSSATTGSTSLYKINWTANNNLTIGSSGIINVDAKGFVGGQGLGVGTTGNQAGGGGYGGKGGTSPTSVAGGSTYGSTSTPTSLGSGGGNSGCGSIGGSGGGAVQLNVTGTTTILGIISANGGNGATSPCWNAGGGSGGSIYISTNILMGAGTVSTTGGNGVSGSSASGDGGGGRISILANTNSATLTRTVTPGTSYSTGSPGTGTTYPEDLPTLSTQTETNNITGTSVTGHGTILSIGYYPIIQYGHVWSTWVNPAVPNTDLTDGGFGTATSSKFNQGVAANAFDNSTSTFWGSDQGVPYDVEYDFATTSVVNKYIIISSPANGPVDSPRDWQFQAWDGSNWINLQSISSQTGWSNNESRAFTLVNTTPYTKYRLYISANNGGGWTRFAEMQMLNTDGSVVANGATTTPGIFTSNISGLTPNTAYYTRSYATTLAGTAYGNNIPFNTGSANNPPNSPSSLGPNNFTTNLWSTSTTPTFTFNLSDPEVTDTVKYRIILDNDSNFSSPLLDYTSALGAQGSASFTVGQTAGSGSYAIGSAGQTLPDNSSYYWEVQAIDSNTATSAFTLANSGSIAFKVDTTSPASGSVSFTSINPTFFTLVSSGSSDAGAGIANYFYTNLTNLTTNGPTVSSSWNNSSLTPNTQYSYTIRITDGVGLTSTTATASSYTLANIPSSPTTTLISNSSILLSWDNNSNSTSTEYYAENSTSAFNSGWVTGTSTLFTGLTCGTSYTFHVKARNASSTETAYSTSVSPSASPCNNNPSAPSSLGYSQHTNGGWTNNSTPSIIFTLFDSDASDTIKYRIQIATSSNFSALVVDYTSALLTQGQKTFTVGQATSTGSYAVGFAGQTLADNSVGYYWRVMATDNNLATSAWSVAAAGAIAFKLDTVAPNVGNLTVTSTTTNAVSLSFSGASDADSGLTSTPYIFFNTTNWNNSGNTTATAWTNSGLAAGTYTYKIRVTDVAGNYTEVLLPGSVTVSGDGGGSGGSDPWVGGITTGFSVFINQNDSITNTKNVTLQLTGQPGTTQMIISNLANFAGASLEPYDTTKFWDLCSGLGSCTNGTYTVYAKFYNASSQSSGSVSDNITYQILNSLTPGILSLTSVSTSTANILISGSADAVYGLAVNPYTFKNRNTGSQSATSSTSSWINTGLTPNTQYFYYAIVGNANSTFGNTADISAYTLANPPTNLSTTTISGTAIGLTWNNNSNPTGTEYQVLNQTTNTASGWITSTSTTVSGLTCASTYDFKVKARNANGTETTYTNLVTTNTSTCPITPSTPPGGGGGGYTLNNFTLSINNGSGQTSNQNVTLNFATNLVNPAKVMVSNYFSFSNSQTFNYSSTINNWDICGINTSCLAGYYAIYAKLLDSLDRPIQNASSQIYYLAPNPPNACEIDSNNPACLTSNNPNQPDAGAKNDPVWTPDFTENEPLTRLDSVTQCKLFNNQPGWYGSYYDYPKNHLGMELPSNLWSESYGDPLSNKKTWVADWYNDKYFRFAKTSPNLKFGSHFFPFDYAPQEFISGHAYHFGVVWTSVVTAPAGSYDYRISSDDDSWLYMDGKLLVDNSGVHGATTKTGKLSLSGSHLVQIFFAERHITEAHFYFEIQDPKNVITYISNNPLCKSPVDPNICDTNPASPECIIPKPIPPTEITPPVITKSENPLVESISKIPGQVKNIGVEIKTLTETVVNSLIMESKQLLLASSLPLKSFFNNFIKIKNSQNTAVGISALTLAPASLYLEYSLASHGLNINAAGSLTEIWLRILQWFYALLAAAGLRKKRRYWGTVYDSESKQPLDPAIVDLVDPHSGKVLEQNITDMYGRFGFLDRPGKFIIRSAKTNYRFPSQIILGKTDLIFDNLYHGEQLEISSDKGIITPNIPMDPMAFDWNQMDKQRVVKIHPRLEYALHIILQTFFWSGALFVLINFLLLPNLFNSISFLVYVVMIIMRRLIPHAHLWGRIVFNSGERANHLLLELHPAKIPTVVTGRAVSAETGKFFLKAMPGKYVLTIKRVDGLTNTLLYTQDITVGKEGVVNEIIVL